jgi:LmbE family N-acetylglucosaminyl deacetylase
MITTNLSGVRRILCIGAHSDDIEIGCGGTILQLVAGAKQIEVYWLVLCSNKKRAQEARQSANAFLKGVKKKTVVAKDFRDGFLPYLGGQVKECFEELKKTYSPDLVFTHFRHDLHQDHRLASELTWNTFRNHLILEYEIPKYDGDLQQPNFFVPLSDAVRRKKVRRLMNHFASQQKKHWYSEDLFNGLMRLRGMEAAAPAFHAEGFYCRKQLLGALT